MAIRLRPKGGSGRCRAAICSAGGRSASFATGNARLSFEIDRGRVTGGITLANTLDIATGQMSTEVSDYFLVRRTALWGDDLAIRLGSQFVEDDLPLFDSASRAGLSLRLTDANQRYEATAFAMQASVWDETRTAFGLSNQNNRVLGAMGHIFPLAGRGLKLSFAGFSGTAPRLLSGDAGTNEGWASSLSLPFARDRGSLAVGLAQTRSNDGTAQTGRALTAEASVLATPPGEAQSLTLTVRHSRIDAGFFSALNPDLIPDEARTEVEAAWYAPQFQANLSAAHAVNDLAFRPDLATDRFREATLNLYYTPQDFTGGFWNGTSLNLTLHAEDLHRVETPVDGPEPQDNRFESLSFGIDRFRGETSWALRFSHERLADLTGGGADQRADRIEALYAFSASDDLTLNLSARLAQIEQDGGLYEECDLSASLSKQLIPDRLSTAIGLGALVTEVPDAEAGRYLTSELAWEFLPDQEFVLSADHGTGANAHFLTQGGGWVVGLSYRRELGLFHGN